MKSLAQSYVWWPGMDAEIKNRVKSCHACQENLNSPTKDPVHPWEWPERAWSRVHIDYAGPFEGSMFLIVIDGYSTYGLPAMLVSDNGTPFTSAEFQEFVSRNAIHHVLTSSYHPASNRLAERAIQTFKSAMKKMSTGPIETRIARFLFNQHTGKLSPGSSERFQKELVAPSLAPTFVL